MSNNRLPETLVKEIREYYDQNKDHISSISVAIKYQIKPSTIWMLLTGKTYKRVGGPIQEKINSQNNIYYQYIGKIHAENILTGEKIVFNNFDEAAHYVINNNYTIKKHSYVKNSIFVTLISNDCMLYNVIWRRDPLGKFIPSEYFLTSYETEEIRNKYFNHNILPTELAKQYRISVYHVYNILHGYARKNNKGQVEKILCQPKIRNSYKHIWQNRILRIDIKTGEEKIFQNLKEAVSDIMLNQNYDQKPISTIRNSIMNVILGYMKTLYGYIWKSLI